MRPPWDKKPGADLCSQGLRSGPTCRSGMRIDLVHSRTPQNSQNQTLPIRHAFAEMANTKGATRVTPFAVCFGARVEITLKHRV